MNKISINIILPSALLWAALLFPACSATKKAGVAKSGLNKEQYLANTSLFIDAKRAEFRGDEEEAVKLFKKVLANDAGNHAADYELSRIMASSNVNLAVEYAKKAVSLDETNKWYLMNLADLYSYAGQIKKSAAVYRKIIELTPSDINNYYRLVNLYLRSSDYDNALKTYYEIEEKFGFSEKNVLRRKDIYFKSGDYRKAAREMKILLEKYPANKRYYGIMADILMAGGKEDQAMKYYKKVLEIDPDDGRIHLVLASYYNSKGDKRASFEELKTAFENKGVDIDSKIKIMMKMYKLTSGFPADESLKGQADTLLEILTRVYPGNPKALAMKGDFLVRDRKWDEAEQAYKKVIAVDSSKYPVWEQLILIAREQNDFVKMQNYTRRALAMFPQYPIVYYFNAVADYRTGNYSEADASLNLGLGFVYKPVQKAEFYTLMGIVRDSLHRYNEAGIAYERALMAVPNDTAALRAYALHLLLENEYEKAESYAKKALELNYRSAESHYVYAKVLKEKGKYDDALMWAKKGLQIEPQNQKLNLLAGRILILKGNDEEAGKYLKKGGLNK
jgi:tetratricopeptide (TPR) repeat protein